MTLKVQPTPKPVKIAGEIWVPLSPQPPHEYFPEPIKHLSRQTISHRWGKKPKHGPSFPRPIIMGDKVQYFSWTALNQYLEELAYPERFTVEAMVAVKNK